MTPSAPRTPNGTLHWDVHAIAQALRIEEEDVREYFTDGRKVSFIVERRIAREVLDATLAPSEGAGFDLVDVDGGKWEVRSISRGGVYFCPSYMVGSGRHFEERGFLKKLDEVQGYVLADIDSFPDIPFWTVHSTHVREWWQVGRLGSSTKISRKNAMRLLRDL